MIGLASVLASCAPEAIEGGFDSGNPAAKIYAIEYAARENNRSAIPNIVAQLDSDDPAVRLVAIAALKRMTGQTYGYHDYDPPEVRREAIDRWEQALKADDFTCGPMPHQADAPPVLQDKDNPSNHG